MIGDTKFSNTFATRGFPEPRWAIHSSKEIVFVCNCCGAVENSGLDTSTTNVVEKIPQFCSIECVTHYFKLAYKKYILQEKEKNKK